MNTDLNMKSIFKKISKRWYVLILFAVLFMSVVFISKTFFQPKEYKSSVEMLMLPKKQKGNEATDATIRLNIQLMNTYMNVMKSNTVLNKVIKELKLKESTNEINNKLKLATDENSLSIRLTYYGTSPGNSKIVANKISEITKHEIKSLFPDNQLIILNKATDGEEMISKIAYVVAGIVGLWAGLLMIFIELLAQRVVKDESDLARLGFPTLGTIACMKGEEND
ncbi:Capsular polysaccharide type 8 biosynthesis protein cap8A [Listeria grayi]|uniref:Lipopolysaccharide biosynthesis protein n=1 Tax=Listeria grayi FSL F6-1183 TaxID=1265827 RepID=A0A829R5U6_LISGR|nr:Wzz/FepE/Etk N-terminal domain-containing protein [Listeria grayi]EUJ26557.1 lipopolysaccharide biosynthesis protein [Listeria grayi FSL F6-1183]VEI36670.1 Capsular polysaccharide type 8 biosynthesis protein cap8A [Listeria grayi]